LNATIQIKTVYARVAELRQQNTLRDKSVKNNENQLSPSTLPTQQTIPISQHTVSIISCPAVVAKAYTYSPKTNFLLFAPRQFGDVITVYFAYDNPLQGGNTKEISGRLTTGEAAIRIIRTLAPRLPSENIISTNNHACNGKKLPVVYIFCIF
jgi:hypothetical protein